MNAITEIAFPIVGKSDDGLVQWKVVYAELLHDIAPHLAHVATFALHAAPGSLLQTMTVSNIESGRAIAHGKSPSAAISAARRKLAKCSPEFIAAAIKADCPEGE